MVWWNLPVLTALLGCGLDLPPPVVTSVSPEVVFNGEDEVVAVLGEDFYPSFGLSSGRDVDSKDLASGFTIVLSDQELGSFELSNVTLADYTRLTAVVPSGLPPGTFDVTVTAPHGGEDLLSEAITVTDSQAAAIDVGAADVSFEVGQTAWVELSLKDPEGQRVFADLSLIVRVLDELGNPVGAVFQPGGLVSQEEDVNGISGSLGGDGTALVGLSVDTPQLVVVTAAPISSREGVAEGSQTLRFEPGQVETLEIGLPDDPMVATAGEPFIVELSLFDAGGNPVENANHTILLSNDCANFIGSEVVQSTATLEVTLKAATGTGACPTDALESLSEPSTRSADIQVLPGPIDRFEVLTLDDEVVAGDVVSLVVSPEDAFGNATMSAVLPTLFDADSGIELVNYVCALSSPPTILCDVTLTQAGNGMTIRVDGELGVTGTSSEVEVLAGDVAALDVSVSGNPSAGVPFVVTVEPADAHGNAVGLDHDDVVLTDLFGEVACGVNSFLPSGALLFDCSLYTATGDAQIVAQYQALTVVGESAIFAVLNGELAVVDVFPEALTAVAGESLSVSLAGFDAYGNAYFDGDKFVDLSDTSSTISPTSATLGQAGSVDLDLVFTLQGTTTVEASKNGTVLGTSEPIAIVAAEADALQVTLDSPWAWVDGTSNVTIEALDSFGNRSDLDELVTVTAEAGAADDFEIQLANGVGSGLVLWNQPRTEEQLAANTGILTGLSFPFPVVRSCLSEPPVAVVDFGGFDDAISCLNSGMAILTVSFDNSVAGGSATLEAFAAAVVGGESALHQNKSTFNLPVQGEGYHLLRGLAIQSDGCGVETTADVWTGKDDGRPVGPVVMTPADESVLTGSGDTSLSIDGVVDCSRDPAANQTLFVRSDRGELTGVVGTGAGLEVTLDQDGDVTFGLSATTAESGGVATIRAWTDEAGGSASVTLSGDNLRPVVWSQDPSGETADLVDEIRLVMSEPLLDTSVLVDRFEVSGGVVESVMLEDAGNVVLLTLEEAVDGVLAGYSVAVSKNVRDVAGNRLDGTWAGVADEYLGAFGNVANTASAAEGCTPDTSVFSPDGDDGFDGEADGVVVPLTSVATPAWWLLSVVDETDTLVYRTRVSGTSASQWRWNGRDASEQVVDAGRYTIEVDAEDSAGNLGGACNAAVDLVLGEPTQ
jgi:hypothetical protein